MTAAHKPIKKYLIVRSMWMGSNSPPVWHFLSSDWERMIELKLLNKLFTNHKSKAQLFASLEAAVASMLILEDYTEPANPLAPSIKFKIVEWDAQPAVPGFQ